MRWLRWVLFVLVLVPAVPVLSDASPATQGTWQEVADDHGIKVWRLEVPGVPMPGFRGEVVIDAPALAVIEVLREVEHHTEWMKNCSGALLLQRITGDHHIIYNRTDIPWPVWDRDVVLDVQFTYAPEAVTIDFKNTDPSLHELDEHVVRMPRLQGSYVMTKLGPTRTRVRYTVEVDVGGSVPMWLAKRVAKEMPYETLDHLRTRVRKTPVKERRVDLEDPYLQ